MGRRPAIAVHLALSLIGAALYIVFVIPRWWVLLGDFPTTLSTVGRIAAGIPIGLAAIPVALYLRESLAAEPHKPEIALRLRAWSGVLHVVAAVLLVLTAVAEIWLHLQSAGPWLFAVYGAAGAIAILGVLAFYLSIVAEQPPKAPKPGKPAKVKKPRGKRKRAETTSTVTDIEAESDVEADGEAEADIEADVEAVADIIDSDTPAETETAAEPADESATSAEEPAATGGLRNKRPTGKSRNPLRR